jgi:hypothetical protein
MTIRKNLTQSESAAIEAKLPQLNSVMSTVLRFSPDLISVRFSSDSSIPVASVCLRDTVDVLCDVKFALFEAFAHKVWFENYEVQSKRWAGAHLARFFADDAALRLYSAGLHLDAGLNNIFEISSKHVSKRGKRKRTNHRLVAMSDYLDKEKPNTKITESIKDLIASTDWNAAVDYRNKWVHNQPPLISGVGIVYERRNRWIISDDAIAVTFGGGDEPHYSVEGLLEFVQRATLLFSDVVTEAINLYVELLASYGVEVTEREMSVAL